jgi:hypothetical protein
MGTFFQKLKPHFASPISSSNFGENLLEENVDQSITHTYVILQKFEIKNRITRWVFKSMFLSSIGYFLNIFMLNSYLV